MTGDMLARCWCRRGLGCEIRGPSMSQRLRRSHVELRPRFILNSVTITDQTLLDPLYTLANMADETRISPYNVSGNSILRLSDSTKTDHLNRLQEHNRRCPAKLPERPQVPPVPLVHRRQARPRIYRCHHRCRHLRPRLQIWFRRYKTIHHLGRRRLLSPERCFYLLDLAGRERSHLRRCLERSQGELLLYRSTAFVPPADSTNQITISTHTDKCDPTYRLSVTYHPSSLNTIPPVTKEISAPFMQWFTADGFFVAAPFQQWLATNVDMVGDADPKNVLDEAAGIVTAQSVQPDGLKDLLNVIKTGPPPAAAPRKRG